MAARLQFLRGWFTVGEPKAITFLSLLIIIVHLIAQSQNGLKLLSSLTVIKAWHLLPIAWLHSWVISLTFLPNQTSNFDERDREFQSPALSLNIKDPLTNFPGRNIYFVVSHFVSLLDASITKKVVYFITPRHTMDASCTPTSAFFYLF